MRTQQQHSPRIASASRWSISAASLPCFLTFALPASAQFSTDEVYADVRDVINDVIERETSRAMARQLTCHSSEGLLVFYPETLLNEPSSEEKTRLLEFSVGVRFYPR